MTNQTPQASNANEAPSFENKPLYHVIDLRSGKTIGCLSTYKRACTKVDALDNEYGAYRYAVKPVANLVRVST